VHQQAQVVTKGEVNVANQSCLSMRQYLLMFSLFAVVALTAAITPRGAHAATLVVDVDGQASAADCTASNIAYTTIQAAVNAAASGDTIKICPGTYNEQVVIRKSNLTILGSGAGVTVLRPTVVTPNTTSVLLGSQVAPILLVDDGALNVTIKNLTIDGTLADSGAILFPQCPVVGFYVGIYYRNSSGIVDTAHVTNMTSSTVCAFAIRAESANIAVTGNLVDRYGESGVACVGPNTQCSITGNAIRGQGPVSGQSQAGIQIRAQAASAISGNVITDHFRIGANGVPQSSVGIFLVFAQPSSNPHLLQQNIFADNQVNVQRVGSAAAF
jgi:hypothetical protein